MNVLSIVCTATFACAAKLQGGLKKSKLLYFSISSLNIDKFLQFFTRRLKKIATRWHAHHTYYVLTLPCKI